MSDREYCRDCIYCEERLSASKQTVYYMCEYPVPDWAGPNVIVNPDHARTCNVQKLKTKETNIKMGP